MKTWRAGWVVAGVLQAGTWSVAAVPAVARADDEQQREERIREIQRQEREDQRESERLVDESREPEPPPPDNS